MWSESHCWHHTQTNTAFIYHSLGPVISRHGGGSVDDSDVRLSIDKPEQFALGHCVSPRPTDPVAVLECSAYGTVRHRH